MKNDTLFNNKIQGYSKVNDNTVPAKASRTKIKI